MPSRVAGASDFFLAVCSSLPGACLAGFSFAGCVGSVVGDLGAVVCGFFRGGLDCCAASRKVAVRVTSNDRVRCALRMAWLLKMQYGKRVLKTHQAKPDTVKTTVRFEELCQQAVEREDEPKMLRASEMAKGSNIVVIVARLDVPFPPVRMTDPTLSSAIMQQMLRSE